jgi:hypothetical protein
MFPVFFRPIQEKQKDQEKLMKKSTIKIGGILILCVVWGLTCGIGCTCLHQQSAGPVGMPEEIYIGSDAQSFYSPRIALWNFNAPDYAGQAGEKAAMLLHAEILKCNPGVDITFIDELLPIDPERLVQTARENKYDLLITGDIAYYLEGGISTDSRVEEVIKIFGVFGKELQMVGFAKAVDIGSPSPLFDYILIHKQTRAAPPAEHLLKRNAAKFAGMVNGMISHRLPEKHLVQYQP